MATARYALTTDAWLLVGAAPCFVQLQEGSKVLFVIEASLPAASRTYDVHTLSTGPHGERTADIGLTGNVYARCGDAAGMTASVVVSV